MSSSSFGKRFLIVHPLLFLLLGCWLFSLFAISKCPVLTLGPNIKILLKSSVSWKLRPLVISNKNNVPVFSRGVSRVVAGGVILRQKRFVYTWVRDAWQPPVASVLDSDKNILSMDPSVIENVLWQKWQPIFCPDPEHKSPCLTLMPFGIALVITQSLPRLPCRP